MMAQTLVHGIILMVPKYLSLLDTLIKIIHQVQYSLRGSLVRLHLLEELHYQVMKVCTPVTFLMRME